MEQQQASQMPATVFEGWAFMSEVLAGESRGVSWCHVSQPVVFFSELPTEHVLPS